MSVGHNDQLGELTEWLAEAARRAGMGDEGGFPELVETWQSRTATLHRFSWVEPSLPDVVVKLHRNPAETQAHFESMRQVARTLEQVSRSDIAVVRPLDISVELRAVVMPFVHGESLSSRLIYGDWSSKAARHEIRALVNRCGALLANYHGNQSDVSDEARKEAADRLKARVERALGRNVDLAGVPASGPVVQCYRDFHPGHVIVTPERKLALIDPPIENRYDYFYRDLALFSHSLFMGLIEPRGMRRNPLRARHQALLSEAFLEGYAASTNHSLTDDDMFYIRAWEAFYLVRMLRKARRRRSYGLMAYYYAPMRHRLRGLCRALTLHLKQTGQQRD